MTAHVKRHRIRAIDHPHRLVAYDTPGDNDYPTVFPPDTVAAEGSEHEVPREDLAVTSLGTCITKRSAGWGGAIEEISRVGMGSANIGMSRISLEGALSVPGQGKPVESYDLLNGSDFWARLGDVWSCGIGGGYDVGFDPIDSCFPYDS